jgi:Ca2+-binding RTX toxin-like protein
MKRLSLEQLEPRRLLAAALSLDTTWGGDGFVTAPANVSFIDEPLDVAAAADGSAVALAVGPTIRQVIRYTPQGAIDNSFGNDGRFLLSFDATAVAIDSAGRVLVAGANTILRLEPDGDVDGGFGSRGLVSLLSPGVSGPSAQDIAFASDGDILLLRTASLVALEPFGDERPGAIVTRLSSDGDIDRGFGTQGSSVFALPLGITTVTEPQAVAIDSAARVMLGGAGFAFGNVRVIRMDSDGTVDGGFEISLTSSAGIALEAIDSDAAGNVSLLTRDTFGIGAATVTQFDATQAQVGKFSFSRSTTARAGVSLAAPSLRSVLVGFRPYEIARLAGDQVAPGVFLDDAGTLAVAGSDASDTIIVNRADSGTLRVTRNGQRTLIPRSRVAVISLAGGAGDDALTVTVDIASVVTGDAGNDRIQTAGGADRIGGGDGNDTVFAGGGKDVVTGGVGADRLYGEGARDRLAGEGGKDRLYGGSGDDLMDGGAADDYLFGEAGLDQLYGYRGNGTLDGGSGVDSLFGGADHDTAVNPGPDLLDAIEAIVIA